MIRHASLDSVAEAVPLLTVAVVEPSFRGQLVTAIGAATLQQADGLAAVGRAIALSAITAGA